MCKKIVLYILFITFLGTQQMCPMEQHYTKCEFGIIKCNHCKKTYTGKRNCISHVCKKHLNVPVPKTPKPRTALERLTQNIRKNCNGVYQCPFCTQYKGSKNKRLVISHIKKIHQNKSGYPETSQSVQKNQNVGPKYVVDRKDIKGFGYFDIESESSCFDEPPSENNDEKKEEIGGETEDLEIPKTLFGNLDDIISFNGMDDPASDEDREEKIHITNENFDPSENIPLNYPAIFSDFLDQEEN